MSPKHAIFAFFAEKIRVGKSVFCHRSHQNAVANSTEGSFNSDPSPSASKCGRLGVHGTQKAKDCRHLERGGGVEKT